jgi:hypothetical protein
LRSDHRGLKHETGCQETSATLLTMDLSTPTAGLGTLPVAANHFFTALNWSTGKATMVKTRNVSCVTNGREIARDSCWPMAGAHFHEVLAI